MADNRKPFEWGVSTFVVITIVEYKKYLTMKKNILFSRANNNRMHLCQLHLRRMLPVRLTALLSLFSFLLLSSLLVSCDNEDDWSKDLGANPLEGDWIREGDTQKFVATFNADHTSFICTYNLATNALEHVDRQGKYRVEGNSLLVYQNGNRNLFQLSEDGNTLDITYGYGSPATEVKYTYKRDIKVEEPEPEPEVKVLEMADVEAAREVLGDLKAGTTASIGMSNWENVQLTKVSLRKRTTIEDTEMTDYRLVEGTLTFTVPQDMPTGTYSLIVAYKLDGADKEVLFDAVNCTVREEVAPPDPEQKILVFKNQMMGSAQNKDFGCLLTVTDAGNLDVQTACYMADDASMSAEENKKRRSEIDMIVNTYSGPSLAFGNYEKITFNLRNYRCNGQALFTATPSSDPDRNNKDLELANAQFPGYNEIQTKFAVLQESVEKEKAIIDLVRSGELTEISETVTPALFDGTTKIDRVSVQSIKPTESVTRWLFDLNGVVVFKSSKNGKIGLMLIREFQNLDGVTDVVDATVVFDLYYQK